ncbi:hypothetical protein AAVH_17145 [Aphelenchoides avenae]|nr:hypothetical protein AAVH_17145 [Aphelenchus avenae]
MLPGVFWLLMLIEAPLLSLHVLVLLILILQMFKRDLTLSPGFSLLFAVQVAVEIVLYLDLLVIARLPEAGLLSSDAIPGTVLSVLFQLLVYAACAQYVSHLVISLNRYTALVHVTQHKTIWGRWYNLLGVVFIVLVVSPLPAMSMYIYNAVQDTKTSYGNVIRLSNADMHMILVAYCAALCFGTCLVSFALSFRSFLAYRKFKPSLKRKYVDDYRLLVFAFLQLIGHVITTIYMTCCLVDLVVAEPGSLTAIAMKFYSYVQGIFCINGSLFLLATSRRLRIYMAKTIFQLDAQFYAQKATSVVSVGTSGSLAAPARRA